MLLIVQVFSVCLGNELRSFCPFWDCTQIGLEISLSTKKIDAFNLWCWKTLESPLNCKEITPVTSKRKSTLNIHWKDWWWSWNSQYFGTWCEELIRWKRPWCWERWKPKGEGGDRGWDGLIAYWLRGQGSEQALWDGEGQASLEGCSACDHRKDLLGRAVSSVVLGPLLPLWRAFVSYILYMWIKYVCPEVGFWSVRAEQGHVVCVCVSADAGSGACSGPIRQS